MVLDVPLCRQVSDLSLLLVFAILLIPPETKPSVVL